MAIEPWLAFVAAATVMLVIPGPTILTVVSYSVVHGRRANAALVSAVALGDATAIAMSVIGLGALMATSALWFSVIKWVGGLYLLYLGFGLLRAGATRREPAPPEAPRSHGRLFTNTYLVTALNPKGIVFFVAFLPQFIDPARAAGPQLWILAGTFVCLATVSATLFAVFASAARSLLDSPSTQRRFNLGAGSLLSTAGVWVLLARRPA